MKVDGVWGLWMLYLADGQQKRICDGAHAAPDWTPDGDHFVYSDGASLRVARSDFDDVRTLPGGAGRDPAWSPDGRQIAYGAVNSIHSRALDGPDVRVWTVVDLACEHPTWSPDGARIAFTDGEGDLVITDGKSSRRYALDGARHPDWSPDGRRILLDHPDGEIRAFVLETGEIERVGSARGQDPSWLQGGKGFLTAWRAPGDEFTCVYEWDAEGKVGTKLTSRDDVRDPAGNW
jgi:Tol biopolymer transport system component